MEIQNLIRERIVANVKIGTKNEKGLPKKLPYFNVEEDKITNCDMVEVFKKLYPENTTKLKIRFTSENPFNFKYKRYVNNKAVCIGNDTKAITVGKDSKNNSIQMEIECSEQCEHRKSGKCKLKGNLKFELEGINAGGLWNLSTSGGISLSNIASEIYKYKKAGMSIVGVPFELTLVEQQSLAYGTYYSIDLHRTDIKPELVETLLQSANVKLNETKQLPEKIADEKKESKKTKKETTKQETPVIEIEKEKKKLEENKENEQSKNVDISKYFAIKKFMKELINGKEFEKIILQDMNQQDVEYILHPKANQDILKYGEASLIELKETKMEMGKNIICKYAAIKVINPDGSVTEYNNEELKEAV